MSADDQPSRIREASASPAPGKRRWLRRLLLTVGLVVPILVFHAPLLRCLGNGLIVDEPLEPTDALLVVGGDGAIQEAAALYRDGLVRHVVLTDDRSARVVQLGIIPPMESIARRELDERGVPAEAIATILLTTPNDWEGGQVLRAWLQEHPGERITVLAGQFESRRVARAVRGSLALEQANRVRLRALPDRRFQASNWWHHRQGIVAVADEYVALGFAVLKGENRESAATWDPDRFEQTLRQAP